MESLSADNTAVFNSVILVSTSPEFLKNQQEFYHAKMALFDNNEENKLEYTNVYQDYVLLMEQILDVTLKNDTFNHTEEQVNEFYKTFKDNVEIYKGMDSDVMDTLFGLVDFAQFKISLMEYKKGFQDMDQGQAEQENQTLMAEKQGLEFDEFMKEYNSNPDDKGSGWVRKITQKEFKNGLTMLMWQKKNPIPGKPDWLRFETSMQNVSNKMAIIDYMGHPEMSGGDMVKEFTEFDKDQQGNSKIYWRMKMPMMSERDNVASMKIVQKEGDKVFFQMASINHPDYPVKKNVVRMFVTVTGFQQPHPTIPKCMNYCEIDQMDMKGNFPSRLLNMVLASSTKAEFEKMYAHIKDKA